ncbi:hypothetical protein V6N13_132658 [Hibiscus sabdariffa]|uniref:RING-type E3 ubiquitin transferase n=2 Tax=Hibiscus sabdariffa TaxID=183260 RepID=A0ABR2PVX7_9ROSI
MLSRISVSTALFVAGSFHVYSKWFASVGRELEYCVVCISKVSEGEKLRWLRCGHGFHACCIDAWLEVGTTCPICRVDVAPDRCFLVSCMGCLAKRVVKWVENPLSSEFTLAFCESIGLA